MTEVVNSPGRLLTATTLVFSGFSVWAISFFPTSQLCKKAFCNSSFTISSLEGFSQLSPLLYGQKGRSRWASGRVYACAPTLSPSLAEAVHARLRCFQQLSGGSVCVPHPGRFAQLFSADGVAAALSPGMLFLLSACRY